MKSLFYSMGFIAFLVWLWCVFFVGDNLIFDMAMFAFMVCCLAIGNATRESIEVGGVVSLGSLLPGDRFRVLAGGCKGQVFYLDKFDNEHRARCIRSEVASVRYFDVFTRVVQLKD